jgi:hypothetical protein
MRFDDLSCAQDFEFPCVSSWIPHDRLLEAVQRQSYDFLEVNSFWEAIFGLRLGVLRQTFKMQDYGVPGSRSHLLIINPQNRLVSQQAYQLLRTQILEAYEYTLSSTDKVVSRLTSQMRMASAPTELLNCNVIAASLRVLYPHIAEAHRTRLTLDWQELKLFYRWFYGKIGHSPEQWGVEGPISLEHLVCDTWA